jgi:hypothetical protein
MYICVHVSIYIPTHININIQVYICIQICIDMLEAGGILSIELYIYNLIYTHIFQHTSSNNNLSRPLGAVETIKSNPKRSK